MKLLTIQQFADEAGVNRQTIYNRIKAGEILTVVHELPCLRIDTSKYPPMVYIARNRGRKRKPKN